LWTGVLSNKLKFKKYGKNILIKKYHTKKPTIIGKINRGHTRRKEK